MMRIATIALAALALTGCGPGGIFNFGGGDVGFNNDDGGGLESVMDSGVDAQDTGADRASASDVEAVCSDQTEASLATEAVGDTIGVEHGGYLAHSCAEIEVGFTVDQGAGTIWVEYLDTAAQVCDDECHYALSYSLPGIPAGDWTVDIDGTTAQVTVAP